MVPKKIVQEEGRGLNGGDGKDLEILPLESCHISSGGRKHLSPEFTAIFLQITEL